MREKFYFQSKGSTCAIPFASIVYLENSRRKVTVHTLDGVYEYYGKLSEAIVQLDDRFLFCHRSFIINQDHVMVMKRGEIIFSDDESICMGRHTYERTRKMIKNRFFA